MPTQWGVIGATSVCQDFVRTLSKLPGDEHKIIGIAAVEDLKAKQLVKQFKIKFFTNAENLAKDTDIGNLSYFQIILILLFKYKISF